MSELLIQKLRPELVSDQINIQNKYLIINIIVQCKQRFKILYNYSIAYLEMIFKRFFALYPLILF